MLAKDELVRVPILLLLKSLDRKKKSESPCRRRGAQTGRADENLHQLQVFEAGQLLGDDAERVSIQVPGETT